MEEFQAWQVRQLCPAVPWIRLRGFQWDVLSEVEIFCNGGLSCSFISVMMTWVPGRHKKDGGCPWGQKPAQEKPDTFQAIQGLFEPCFSDFFPNPTSFSLQGDRATNKLGSHRGVQTVMLKHQYSNTSSCDWKPLVGSLVYTNTLVKQVFFFFVCVCRNSSAGVGA